MMWKYYVTLSVLQRIGLGASEEPSPEDEMNSAIIIKS